MQGTYFDGRRATPHTVEVAIAADRLELTGDGIHRAMPLDAVEITDAIGSTPRLVRFADGAVCEVADRQALAAALAQAGRVPSLIDRMEARWPLALAAVGLVLLVAFLGLRYGAPALADGVAERLPPGALDTLSENALKVFDATVFAPPEIDPGRREALTEQFNRLWVPPGVDRARLRLLFRRSDAIGPNALALPSGDIVVTDALVELAASDPHVMSVLAHEVGHVARRHGLRKILQGSAVALFFTWYLGDVGTLVLTAPTTLLNNAYSREFEREADAFAADMLRGNGLDPGLLADMLEKLEQAHGGGRDGAGAGYLSTHPLTAERIRSLR